jgi:hypothetical protein
MALRRCCRWALARRSAGVGGGSGQSHAAFIVQRVVIAQPPSADRPSASSSSTRSVQSPVVLMCSLLTSR